MLHLHGFQHQHFLSGQDSRAIGDAERHDRALHWCAQWHSPFRAGNVLHFGVFCRRRRAGLAIQDHPQRVRRLQLYARPPRRSGRRGLKMPDDLRGGADQFRGVLFDEARVYPAGKHFGVAQQGAQKQDVGCSAADAELGQRSFRLRGGGGEFVL
jgi:hypothetical protein